MIYGYARVSTAGQSINGNSLEDQTKALEAYGCQEIVTEAFTGKTMERPQFSTLFQKLQPGDTLVVCKLDRFARTAIEGVSTVRELFERGMIVERTQTGKAVARQDSNYREGRPKKYLPGQIDHALDLLQSGKTYRQVENMTGISKSTLVRARNRHR